MTTNRKLITKLSADDIRYINSTYDAKAVVNQLMDVSEQALYEQGHRALQPYVEGKLYMIKWQQEALDGLMSSPTDMYSMEVAPGRGKTVVAARGTAEHLRAGGSRVLYLCPAPLALGDEWSGIINSFYRTVNDPMYADLNITLGHADEASVAYDVTFMTPQKLISLMDTQPRMYQRLVDSATMMVIDEAQHFAANAEEAQLVYGRIHPIAERFMRRGRVLCMTATHGRMDGGVVMGVSEPDFKYTVQNAIDDGLCPDVHGLQVFLDVECEKVSIEGGIYHARMDDANWKKYIENITDVMAAMWQRAPDPTCAFVARREDAKAVAERFNEITGLGNRGLHVLIDTTSPSKRKQLVEGINSGDMLGYVTCAVGAEALNIPSLTTCHMILRTASYTRLVQMPGRALRTYDNKPVARIADYNLVQSNILKGCKGLLDWAALAGSRLNCDSIYNGGPLVARPDKPAIVIKGYTMSQERAWVVRRLSRNHEINLASYLVMAEGAERGRKAKNWYAKNGDNAASPFDVGSPDRLGPVETDVIRRVADEIHKLEYQEGQKS